MIALPRDDFPPSHFHAVYDSESGEFSIVPPRLLRGGLSPRAVALVTEWAALHERELLEAWEDHASGQEPQKIEPLR